MQKPQPRRPDAKPGESRHRNNGAHACGMNVRQVRSTERHAAAGFGDLSDAFDDQFRERLRSGCQAHVGLRCLRQREQRRRVHQRPNRLLAVVSGDRAVGLSPTSSTNCLALRMRLVRQMRSCSGDIFLI